MPTKTNLTREAQSALTGFVQVQAGRGVDAMRQAFAGGERIASVARQFANASQPNQVAGRVFEELHAATGNIDAALKSLPQRFATTASNGLPHAAADLVTKVGGETLAMAQAKLSESTTALTRRLSEIRYDGMQKLVPEGMAEPVRKVAGALADAGRRADLSLRDTTRQVTERFSYAGAHSKPVSINAARQAASDPHAAAKTLGTDAALGAYGAAAGMGGVMASVVATQQGGSVTEVAKAAATGVARGLLHQAATAGVDKAGVAVLTQLSSKAAATFSHSGAAGPIARAGVGVATDLIGLARGKISGGECAQRAVKHGVRAGSTWAGAQAGAALGAFGGPIGAAVGGLAGGLIGSQAPDWFSKLRN